MQPWSWPRSALHVRPSSLSLYGGGGDLCFQSLLKLCLSLEELPGLSAHIRAAGFVAGARTSQSSREGGEQVQG